MASLLHGRRRAAAAWIVAATALAALSFTSVAAADRPSADAEHAALAIAANQPPQCVETWISDVDATWAELFATNADDCAQADGVTLWRQNAGVWTRVYDGPFDEHPCPLDIAVPDAVARDFGLCFRPSRQAYAVVGVNLRVRPRFLIQGAHGVYRKLRWHRWG